MQSKPLTRQVKAVGAPLPLERILVLNKRPNLIWEGDGVTNPSAVRLADGTIAMVYRACGSDGNGYLGFCRLDSEGRKVIEGSRSELPFHTQNHAELKEFPEGYGDPRLNKVGDWYYIWANGRNNAVLNKSRQLYDNDFRNHYIGGRQTVALRTKDFKSVEYLGLHGPKEFDKNTFLHPDPVIIGTIPHWALFHRIQYNIQVALATSLEDYRQRSFWKEHVSKLNTFTFAKPLFDWEGVSPENNWPGSIAGGAPSIEIESAEIRNSRPDKRYWLFLYNASGVGRAGKVAQDRRIGALIYTIKDNIDSGSQPFEIIARAPMPILEPKEEYEKNGPNGDVVFVTGIVKSLDGKTIDVFYGSGDTKVSKARFDLVELLGYVSSYNELGILSNS